MDPDGLFQTVREHRISMCGVLPACIVLDVLRQWKSPLDAEFVSYGTSAEVTKDNSRVVGYAGMLFN
jgi:AmmeMemoRadiSam system protein B